MNVGSYNRASYNLLQNGSSYCNLTWESVGRRYYQKFKESGLPIEEIETILSLDGQSLRWLPTEVIAADQVEAYLENLDERCAIPKPRSIRDSVNKSIAA